MNTCIVNRNCSEYVFSQHVVHTTTGNFELGNFAGKFSSFFVHYSDENREIKVFFISILTNLGVAECLTYMRGRN